jgi:RNA polymerase-binding transcription factor DksA
VDEIERAQRYDEHLRECAEQAAVANARKALAPQSGYAGGVARCRGCGSTIPAARRHAVPSAVFCLACATANESKARHFARGA